MLGPELGQEQLSLKPLQPLLSISSSSTISGALGLFQLPSEEEVSSGAQPDDIYFPGGRDPCLLCAVSLGCRSLALKAAHAASP